MWLTPDDKERSIVVFMRTDEKGNSIICMTNFTSAFYPQFRFGLPQPGSVDEVFNTDLKDFGGSNQYNAFSIQAEEEVCNGLPYSVQVCVPPMSTVYFDYKKQPLPKKPKETKAAKTKAITDTKQEDRDDGTA